MPFKGYRVARPGHMSHACAEELPQARDGSPPRFPPAHRQEHGSHHSSGSLVATHDHSRRRLGSTSSNSSCGSAEYPGEAILHQPASFSGNPLSHSWPQCWSPQSTGNPLSPPLARSPATWLGKPWGSSSLAKPTPGCRPVWPPLAARLPSKALGS
ncbi:pancreatic progenitor cell differentiation and proliferation factor-like [Camelus ferus]|uniref:Pancreatic progenitor cell differentiation and proliferation factor-like n=1 Tax=Camelus ferus TaxID=419612 RepID=A0A8B8TAD2_CAMFR|nr:pancreatic progenitor cell differentiation and proliferation factor-like [Camelus ferus]